MPYITKKRQQELKKLLPTTPGDLTYLLTMDILHGYSEPALRKTINKYLADREPRYEDYCTIMGALWCTAIELRRRREGYQWAYIASGRLEAFAKTFYGDVIAPYEDQKRQANGDVYNT